MSKSIGKYDKYFDGKIHRLELGKDCPKEASQVYSIIQKAGRRIGLEVIVRTRSVERAAYVQAVVNGSRDLAIKHRATEPVIYFRTSPEFAAKVRESAARDKQSVNEFVFEALKSWIEAGDDNWNTDREGKA